METNIRKEYERLKQVWSSTAGKEQIDEVWMRATNHVFEKGIWMRKEDSVGDQVAGFAIDIKPPHCYILSAKGGDHSAAYHELIERAWDNGNGMSLDEAEARIYKGWAAYSDEWAYPLITINGIIRQDFGLIEVIGETVLAQEIGLPIFILHFQDCNS